MQHRVVWLIIGILGISAAVALAGIGGLLASLMLISTLAFKVPLDIGSLMQAAGIIALGVGVGGLMALQGWARWQERPSRPFDPTRARWLWLAQVFGLVLLVLLGAAVDWLPQSLNLPVSSDLKIWGQALLLPPIHVLAMSISPLLMIGLVGWGLRGTGGTRRDVVAGIAGGGCLGMSLSLVIEILAVIAGVIVLTIGIIVVPGGIKALYELRDKMQDPAWQTNASNIAELFLSPVVIASIFGFTCIVAPLAEEALKTLASGVMGGWIRPAPGRAFLWGVAAGGGFALAENLLNGAIGGTGTWGIVAVGRVGATAMHCLASGLLGWGWGQLWTARRPLRLLGAYAAAVAIHSLWNTLVVGTNYAGLLALTSEGVTQWNSIPGLVAIVLVITLVMLALSFLIALLAIARRLADQADWAVQETPQL